MSAFIKAGDINDDIDNLDDFCEELFDEWIVDEKTTIDDENENKNLIIGAVGSHVDHNTENGSRPQKGTPMEQFRLGYLWVSDLTKQNWCEQQLWYTFTVPTIKVEDPIMTQGSNLHLARELAVHDIVQVSVSSSEDIWAIKVLNLLTAIQAFHHGKTVAREIPVFGAPFGEEVWLVGLIDELRFDPERYTIDLSELKTRQSKGPPTKAQKKQHKLQVMLYKVLFDNLVKGKVSKHSVAKHMKVSLTKEFGDDVKMQIKKQMIEVNKVSNLSELIDFVFQQIQTLTCINQLMIEYVHQVTEETLLHDEVRFCEEEVHSLFSHSLKFWRGQRSAEGVDIEEAWKCNRCDFEAICDWRQRKSDEYAKLNACRNKMK